MKKSNRPRITDYIFLFLLGFGFATTAALAKPPLNIEWKDLIPKEKPLKDPLSHLSPDHAMAIDTISWARTLSEEERKQDFNLDGIEDAKKYEQELKKEGHDVDQLLKDYAQWQTAVDERDKAVRPDLDGKLTRMSGYLLPLEFNEAGETEFILVPYVGACIHAPAPPANQVVLVSLQKPFKVNDLFTPVWVTGSIKTKASSKTLTLIDGSANVAVGYHLTNAAAELYKKE